MNTKEKECFDKLDAAVECVMIALMNMRQLLGDQEEPERRHPIFYQFEPRAEQEDKNVDNGILEFSKEELEQMPKEYSKLFRTGGIKARVRKKLNGVYEVRATKNGMTIAASSKNNKQAKLKFIEKLKEFPLYRESKVTPSKNTINEFIDNWITTIKKPVMKDITYKAAISRLKRAKEFFADKSFKKLTPMIIQPYFNLLVEEGKSRTAEATKVLLNQAFRAAVRENLIKQNPIEGIELQKHEYVNGTALTIEEERIFVNRVANDEKLRVFLFFLYTGIRRGELPDVTVTDKFVIVKNGKQRKGKKDSFRKIPITPMLRPYLPIDLKVWQHRSTLSGTFKKICPNHHLHELRHTFVTRCQECGVSREVVSTWVGHAADKTMTSTVYTHFSDEYFLKEADKVNYPYQSQD